MSLLDRLVPERVEGLSRTDYIKKLKEDRQEVIDLNESIRNRIRAGYFKIKGTPQGKEILEVIAALYKNHVSEEYGESNFSYEVNEEEKLKNESSTHLVRFWQGVRVCLGQAEYEPKELVFLSVGREIPINLYHEWKDWARTDKQFDGMLEETIGKIYYTLLGTDKSIFQMKKK